MKDINKWIVRISKSKTMWFNSIMLIFVQAWPEISAYLLSLEPTTTAASYQWIALVILIGNIYYRTQTTQALKDK